MSAATSAEDALTREKAAGMSLLQLQEETKRCQYGIDVATSPGAKKRFERRLQIMRDALALLTTRPGGDQ